MAKPKNASAAPVSPTKTALARAPLIWINDPSTTRIYATTLASMIPRIIYLPGDVPPLGRNKDTIRPSNANGVVMVSEIYGDDKNTLKQARAQLIKSMTISTARNFASVNLFRKTAGDNTSKWGTNHLDLCIGESSTDDQTHATEIAKQVYQWFFSVFTVLETLYLIPDEQMQITDSDTAFRDYAYCPIAESRIRPKDAKIQFVALIMSKPVVGPNKRISFQVADKTGIANFYFQHRGEISQYTWDWVLALKPGDRKCLPRMPMVEIKERKLVAVVKAPFRLTGAIVRGTGHATKAVGRGLCKVGSAVAMGKRSEWVPEADVTINSKGKPVKKTASDDDSFGAVPNKVQVNFKVFNEKGEKTWSDNDSIASTTAGSLEEEKKVADIV